MSDCRACTWRNKRRESGEGGASYNKGCAECDKAFEALMEPLQVKKNLEQAQQVKGKK